MLNTKYLPFYEIFNVFLVSVQGYFKKFNQKFDIFKFVEFLSFTSFKNLTKKSIEKKYDFDAKKYFILQVKFHNIILHLL